MGAAQRLDVHSFAAYLREILRSRGYDESQIEPLRFETIENRPEEDLHAAFKVTHDGGPDLYVYVFPGC